MFSTFDVRMVNVVENAECFVITIAVSALTHRIVDSQDSDTSRLMLVCVLCCVAII